MVGRILFVAAFIASFIVFAVSGVNNDINGSTHFTAMTFTVSVLVSLALTVIGLRKINRC